ncbi:MAG: hypothetical protein KGL53_16435 [Elusimicrobia bacterium]|nr:hypothetical protein [Elusimicrobiota bacterium]
MRLYVNGVRQAEAVSGGAAVTLLGESDILEAVDGKRRLALQRGGGLFFLEVQDGACTRYGMPVDAEEARRCVGAFLGGELPAPSRESLLKTFGGGPLTSVSNGFEDDCPLCRMGF